MIDIDFAKELTKYRPGSIERLSAMYLHEIPKLERRILSLERKLDALERRIKEPE